MPSAAVGGEVGIADDHDGVSPDFGASAASGFASGRRRRPPALTAAPIVIGPGLSSPSLFERDLAAGQQRP